MIHLVLVEPEIPPNTGNVARTCAATGVPLHLVEPLGFSISDKHLRRAGLDYWENVALTVHTDTTDLFRTIDSYGSAALPPALITTKGNQHYTKIAPPGPGEELFVLFGPETRGLSKDLLARFPDRLYRIPMAPGQRSLNLSNSVAIVAYELLRTSGFPGLF